MIYAKHHAQERDRILTRDERKGLAHHAFSLPSRAKNCAAALMWEGATAQPALQAEIGQRTARTMSALPAWGMATQVLTVRRPYEVVKLPGSR